MYSIVHDFVACYFARSNTCAVCFSSVRTSPFATTGLPNKSVYCAKLARATLRARPSAGAGKPPVGFTSTRAREKLRMSSPLAVVEYFESGMPTGADSAGLSPKLRSAQLEVLASMDHVGTADPLLSFKEDLCADEQGRSILADVLEALVGAVALQDNAGLERAQRNVLVERVAGHDRVVVEGREAEGLPGEAWTDGHAR